MLIKKEKLYKQKNIKKGLFTKSNEEHLMI